MFMKMFNEKKNNILYFLLENSGAYQLKEFAFHSESKISSIIKKMWGKYSVIYYIKLVHEYMIHLSM